MNPATWFSKRRGGLAVGVAMTAVGCGLYALGLLDGLEAAGLDLHQRHLSTIRDDPRIVLIDIDDSSLEAFGDWPWPRRRHAELVRTLDELGADRIVLDLVFAGHSPRRIDDAGHSRHYDFDVDLSELGDPAGNDYIYDDDELRDAMLAAGNVYLAVFGALSPPDIDPSRAIDRALAAVQQDPQVSFARLVEVLSLPVPWVSEQFYHRIRIAALLDGDFGLDETVLAGRLAFEESAPGGNRQVLRENLAAAKQLMARRAARSFLRDRPTATWSEFFEAMLPDREPDALSPDRECLLTAFRRADAYRSVERRATATPSALEGRIPHAHDLTLPIDKLAGVARGFGFVAFMREESGGVLRAVPLFIDADGVLLPQLGLAVAMDVWGVNRSSFTIDGSELIVGDTGNERRVELDDGGLTIVNWHVPHPANDWRGSFTHIPVAHLLQIPANRSTIADNEKRLGIAVGELVERRHADTPAEYAAYARLINERRDLRERASLTMDTEAGAELRARLETIDATIADIEREAANWLRHAWQLWEKETPQDDDERAEREQLRHLHERFGLGQYAKRLDTLNGELALRMETLVDELRPRIEGKICLVGYTASASAELITSPVHASVPGVMAHANVLNMLLRNRPVVPLRRWANVLLLSVTGLVVTFTSCARGWRFSLASLPILSVVILGLAGLLFRTATIHAASLVAVTLVTAVWVTVMVYRQSTEERARRHLQRALTQYTSPAVASHIAERVDVADLAPRTANVTCFFSDLRGFTSLSERLGAERTRLVLNPFLGEMSRVLIEHDAIVNKFIGDGIFAFFNAPIHPCSNHAGAGCRTALASFDTLDRLNRRSRTGNEVERTQLVMGIGLSTGEAFVGDYGSDSKLDYTCIGDTVNVASRLEAANKVLGTSVLVDEAARQRAGDEFEFRSLGLLKLAGKTAPVAAHELIGFSDRVDDATRDYTSRFERVVGHYQACEWDLCLVAAAKCRRLRSDDRALAQYERAVESLRDNPPPVDWNRAIPIATT